MNDATLRKAEKEFESCEDCNLDGAETPFDVILDQTSMRKGNLVSMEKSFLPSKRWKPSAKWCTFLQGKSWKP